MVKLNFKDRAAEYLHRVKLSAVAGATDTFDVTPVFGTVTEQGTPLNAQTFNELQNNINNELVSITNNATNLKNQIESGWIPLSGTFTCKSANEITVNTDFTSKLTAGMKIKIVIGGTVTDTIKIVNATTITINNAVLPTVHPITEVCFSMAQTPLGFTVGDYITEIDNSGIWTYEKYNSGKITLKTEVTYTPEQKLVQVPSSNIYATPLEIALPFTLTDANYDAKIYGVYCYLMGTKLTDSTASILRYSLYSAFPYTAGLGGTKCTVEVTGRWK
ncbi:MAG: hypothetical protein RSF40_07355 [Oscillospiraceae bacterium]